MAKSKKTKRAAARAASAILATSHASTATSPATVADLQRRRSGAAGAHADSSVRRNEAGGRNGRMGSRRARNLAAMRDCS